ncbi:MAG: exodeoxyribonuclease VII large subunit [Candidatus Omnitrophica bacterium]|nr:exodeoxyribonuclease VII large subunit [Candidatus Omnitrophota bacterium]
MAEEAEKRVHTVTEITRDIKFVLEGAFRRVWVEGEVSNYRSYMSGHVYFSLKDKDSLLSCVLFKGVLRSKEGFRIEDGMQLICLGRLTVYGPRGVYQLCIDNIEVRGKGVLGEAFEQLKKKLHKEGLFNEERKRPLPFLPEKIAVVTSPSGAAIMDILKVVRERYANTEVILRPVKVQGDTAKDEIADAIRELNEYNGLIREGTGDGSPIEVMIVGRGGGSLEDLWPFNEEKVARAIFDSDIPIISAVGHEIDYTISDMVADKRAPTPTAAAEMVVPRKDDLVRSLKEIIEGLNSAAMGTVKNLEEKVTRLKDSYVLKTPINVFLQMQQRIDDMFKAAQVAFSHTLNIRQRELAAACGKLNALSPLAVMERGYSVTFKGGRAVKDSNEIGLGDLVSTRLFSGRFTAVVSDIKKDGEDR